METAELIYLQNMINELKTQINDLMKAKVEPVEKMQSDELDKFFTALSKAQGEFKVAFKSKENKAWKSGYADFCDIIAATGGALEKNELSVMQDISEDKDGSQWLVTIVAHSSGQFRKSKVRIVPAKNMTNPLHGWKSAVTYMKRTVYETALNIVTTDGSDDDGNAAFTDSREIFKQGTALEYQTKQTPDGEIAIVINKTEFDQLMEELDGWPDIAKNLLRSLDLRSLSDLPKSQFKPVMTFVRESIKVRKEGQKQ
jgi:hypothetical protein